MVSYVVDTSVLTRLHQGLVLRRIAEIGTPNCNIAVASVLEMGFSARNAAEHTRVTDMLGSTFTVVAASPWAQEYAIQMQGSMAAGGAQRSARVADLLIAATAMQLNATVLHYDRDFDTVARLTGSRCEWVSQAGSLDR